MLDGFKKCNKKRVTYAPSSSPSTPLTAGMYVPAGAIVRVCMYTIHTSRGVYTPWQCCRYLVRIPAGNWYKWYLLVPAGTIRTNLPLEVLYLV